MVIVIWLNKKPFQGLITCCFSCRSRPIIITAWRRKNRNAKAKTKVVSTNSLRGSTKKRKINIWTEGFDAMNEKTKQNTTNKNGKDFPFMKLREYKYSSIFCGQFYCLLLARRETKTEWTHPTRCHCDDDFEKILLSSRSKTSFFKWKKGRIKLRFHVICISPFRK